MLLFWLGLCLSVTLNGVEKPALFQEELQLYFVFFTHITIYIHEYILH